MDHSGITLQVGRVLLFDETDGLENVTDCHTLYIRLIFIVGMESMSTHSSVSRLRDDECAYRSHIIIPIGKIEKSFEPRSFLR